jgi:hypothetical protein
MLGENKCEKEHNLNHFIQLLQNNNLVIYSTHSPTTTSLSPRTSSVTSSRSSSQATITRLPDVLSAVPSAAAGEDDLE